MIVEEVGGAGGQACLAHADVAIAGAVFPRCAMAVADGDCGSVGSNFGFLFLSGDDILMVIDGMLIGRFCLLLMFTAATIKFDFPSYSTVLHHCPPFPIPRSHLLMHHHLLALLLHHSTP